MKSIFFVLVSCFCFLGISQELEYEKIVWEEEPKRETLDSAYSAEQEVVLKNERIIEFTYSDKYDRALVEYFTFHKIVRVIGDDAIQKHNKIYIGMNRVVDLVDVKVRVITPENKVINFDEVAINESQSEDGEVGLKYFAIDGVVKGADIEYTYTVLKIPSHEGVRLELQNDYLQKDVSLKLIAPENLGFAFKSYNGLPDVEQDTTEEGRNVYSVHIDSIGRLKDEVYMAYDKNIKHIIYKLDVNAATRRYNLVSFGETSQTIYNAVYKELEGAAEKKIKKFVNEIGVKDATTEEEKVRIVENAIKTKIGIIENVQLKTIDQILTDGYTSNKGMTYLMVNVLKYLGIKHELVLTCDRYSSYFDEDFQHSQVLQEELIYFPNFKKYLAPSQLVYRLGMIPSSWTNQKGLFIKEIKVGDMVTGLGKVKFIKPLDYKITQDLIDIELDLSEMYAPVVNFQRSLSGYSSVYFQSVYNMLEDNDKKGLDEGLIKFADEKGELVEYTISGVDKEDIGINPVVYKGKLSTTSLVEKAGNRYLLNVGQLIGPQMEMYQEEKRVSDIEHDHNMTYYRVIKFEIPDGYEISGLDALKINENYPLDDPKLLFISDYSQNGNKVEITIEETYKEMLFKKEEIEGFRKVVNAAANFNKVVLFISKV